jgi:hypothetical protein
MNKRKEEKILDEIRRRALEADRKRREKNEHEDELDVHLDVLDEMTDLSRKEIEEIERTVRKEHLLKQQKNKKILLYSGLAFLLLLSFAYSIYRSLIPQAEIVTEETFDNNANSWGIFDEFEYRRTYKNGVYVFETNVDGWCYWDDVKIEYPQNYDIEVHSQWLGGLYGSYGFSILESDNVFLAFNIKGDGGAAYGKVVDGEWVIDKSYLLGKANTAEKNFENVQVVKVRNRKFQYFVNNQMVYEGDMDIMAKNVGIRSCGEQQIAFKKILITNADNHSIIFDDDFSAQKSGWNAYESLVKRTSFQNGDYKFSTNKSICYWVNSSAFTINKNSTVLLTVRWENGERSEFGLMLMMDNSNYAACELKNDGTARLIINENAQYISVPSFNKASSELTGNNRVTIKAELKDNTLFYYLEDFLVDSYVLPFYVTYIGLRVCGKQSVAFEHLTIKTPED